MDCFENSKSVIGSSAQRGTHPRAQWHTGTAPIGDARRAHRGSASVLTGSSVSTCCPCDTWGAWFARVKRTDCFSYFDPPRRAKVDTGKQPRRQRYLGTASVGNARRAHRHSAAEIELAGSGGSKLPAHDTRPVGASRAMNRRIVSMNSKSLSGSRVHSGSYPRAQWHTGTSFIRNMRRARRGSAAGSN